MKNVTMAFNWVTYFSTSQRGWQKGFSLKFSKKVPKIVLTQCVVPIYYLKLIANASIRAGETR